MSGIPLISLIMLSLFSVDFRSLSDNLRNELLRTRLDLGVGYGGDYCVHILVIFVCVVHYV